MDYPDVEPLWSSLWSARSGEEAIRLRFELGGDFDNIVQPVPRFLQAHGRASAVADALFSADCVAVVASQGCPADQAGLSDDVMDGFVALQSTGFDPPRISEWQANLHPWQDSETRGWDFRSFDLGDDKVARDTLLWHAIAYEMPIYPSARVATFLLNPSTSVMLHVYDDRGMDVIAHDPAKLRSLHADFAGWLLDYDRERMTKLF
jgi:hypothetical protein